MDRIPGAAKYEAILSDTFSTKYATNSILRECLSSLPPSVHCGQVTHTWNESCLKSAFLLFFGSYTKTFKVYLSLYLLSAILRGRSLKYYLTRLPTEVLRSSTFLSANCFFFLGFFCLHRKFFGHIDYWGSLLFNIPACMLSILLERKQRRGVLALYLTNLAAETAFNMMADRKWISSIRNGEVLLFCIASAIYSLLFKFKSLDGSILNLIKIFVGESEIIDNPSHHHIQHNAHNNNTQNHELQHAHHSKLHRKSRIIKYYGFVTDILNNFINLCNNLIGGGVRHHRSHNSFIVLLRAFETKIDNFLNLLNHRHGFRHRLCNHRYNCLTYAITGFVQRFIAGYLLQAAVKCVSSITSILKNPKVLIKILKSPVNKQLGLFLGSYVLIYRGISCLLKWITNRNSRLHGLISGFFSGWSMIYYKSSSIALYLNFKLIEILWMIGVKNNQLPLYKSFDVVLYTLSTAFVLWVALYEPHNIRAAYWKFLVKISDNKFALVNRFAFDVLGLKSSTIDRQLKQN